MSSNQYFIDITLNDEPVNVKGPYRWCAEAMNALDDFVYLNNLRSAAYGPEVGTYSLSQLRGKVTSGAYVKHIGFASIYRA